LIVLQTAKSTSENTRENPRCEVWNLSLELDNAGTPGIAARL